MFRKALWETTKKALKMIFVVAISLLFYLWVGHELGRGVAQVILLSVIVVSVFVITVQREYELLKIKEEK